MAQPTDLTSVETNGLGFITVNSNGTVSCTPRLKTGNGLHQAGWLVQNNTDSNLSVDLTNFRPLGSAGPLTKAWIVAPPVDVDAGKFAPIVGLFTGQAGDKYEYDVQVNGALAIDPQLEI